MIDRRTQGADRIVPRRSADGEAGYSLLEVTIASMLLLLLSWLVVTLSNDGIRTQNFTQRMSRVTEITQDVMDDIRTSLTSSVRVFGTDAISAAYLARVRYADDMSPALVSSRLPSARANESLGPEDPLDPKTGNTLFMARYAWTDEYETSSGGIYRIDVYRLEWWYLTAAGPGPRAGVPDGLNLARWVSEPLADAGQIARISDPNDQAEMLVHMLTGSPDRLGNQRDPLEVVWNIGGDPAVTGTFRQIEGLGSLSDSPQAPRNSPWEIEPDPHMCQADILDYRHHSVATNFAPPQMGVGRFSAVSNDGGGFPHGLEIQVVGPSSSRQILIHLSLVTTRADDHRAYFELQSIADTRDN